MLDAVEHRREVFVVHRNGRPIAEIVPATVGTGRSVKEIIRSHARDPAWERELAELRAGLRIEERRWNA